MLTVLMCLTGLTGCSKWTYTTYVTDDYFNRIGFGPLYYIWIEYDDYENPDAPKEITIEQDGKNYTAAYKHTHRMYNYSYSYDLYESEELVVYKASETGFTHYVEPQKGTICCRKLMTRREPPFKLRMLSWPNMQTSLTIGEP